MQIKKHFSITSKKLIVAAIMAIVILGAIALAYATSDDVGDQAQYESKQGIDMSPATPEDQARSDQLKENSTKDNPKPPIGQKQSVIPTIVDAGQYGDTVEVRAFVSGTIEDGGKCEFTFSNGDNRVVKENVGFGDATTTKCPNISINKSEFPTLGSWALVISYTSGSSSGMSAVKNIEVK